MLFFESIAGSRIDVWSAVYDGQEKRDREKNIFNIENHGIHCQIDIRIDWFLVLYGLQVKH